MSTTINTIIVSDTGLNALQTTVADLNKRAAKHQLAPVVVTVVKTVEFVEANRKGFHASEPLHTVEINCDRFPVIDGWQLIAKIEFDSELGNMVQLFPGVDSVDTRYRTVAPICEHCNTARRRRDVIVLRHTESGEEKIVGRNCLADFIRTGDAETLARFAEFMDRLAKIDSDSLEESDSDYCDYNIGCNRGPIVKTLNYLATVSAVIRKCGWVSKTVAKERPDTFATAEIAGRCFWGFRAKEFRAKQDLYPTDKDLARAEAALEWARQQEGSDSEYLHNIARLANCATLNWKYEGYVASIIAAHGRACDRENELKKQKLERTFLGKVGERVRGVLVQVVRMRFIEGMYGAKTIVTMEAAVGEKRAVLTWFATGDKDGDFSEGDFLLIDTTIKKHESHPDYGDSTIVTRTTVKSREETCVN